MAEIIMILFSLRGRTGHQHLCRKQVTNFFTPMWLFKYTFLCINSPSHISQEPFKISSQHFLTGFPNISHRFSPTFIKFSPRFSPLIKVFFKLKFYLFHFLPTFLLTSQLTAFAPKIFFSIPIRLIIFHLHGLQSFSLFTYKNGSQLQTFIELQQQTYSMSFGCCRFLVLNFAVN